jgi:hypothetical protein
MAMRALAGRLFLVSSLLLASGTAAHAQFGLPLPGARGLPLPLPGRRGLPLPLPGIHGRHGFARTLGVIGAVTVGAVILHRLSVRDRHAVALRARQVVARDPNERVVETYRSQDGGHQVTMTAEPARRAAEFKDDPALQKIADTDEQAGKANARNEPKMKAKGAKEKDPPDKEMVKLTDLPEDASCRRVTTEFEAKAPATKKKGTADAKESNTAIMCQTSAGEWRPAGA